MFPSTPACVHLKQKLGLPESCNNGVVAVASMRYPRAVWEGCIKARIGNPELKTIVSRLVVNEVVQWMDNHPTIKNQVRQLQTFQFPEAWSGKLG
jgi:DNA gyrase/topoisomerase IV subunit B